jgi:hypothetical protein
MLEGWLSDLLAGYLGHFLDVKREQLRVSLWNGMGLVLSSLVWYQLLSALRPLTINGLWTAWRTGFILENVQIKVEAFEYLQLPVEVSYGCIGRLEVQVRVPQAFCFTHHHVTYLPFLTTVSMQIPWRALRALPVVIELADVELRVAERPETDWEEEAAGKRLQASKEAILASRELERLSKPVLQQGAEVKSSPSSWSFFSHLGGLILNGLQLAVRNVHIVFEVNSLVSLWIEVILLQQERSPL